MHDHLIAAIMGLVEGLTEFLPVSSTGHLIVFGELLGFTGPISDTFKIFIQLGAMLAVVVYYRPLFLGLFRRSTPGAFGGGGALVLLAVTTVPALIAGKLGHEFIKHHLFFPGKVAIGLCAGSVWILLTERFYKREEPVDLDRLTWRVALGIGVFQCLALWPGVSRSAATILGAMLLGLNRRAATEYSFFAAVPLIAVATIYDIIVNWPVLTPESLPYFTTGIVVAFLSAWAAIKLFVQFVSRRSLNSFAWYRLLVAALVFALM